MAGKIEDAKITLKDGKMHYLALGTGPAVILLHSMAGSVWSWSKVLEPLAQGHTVYALDTMGQGDSDKPSRDYTMPDYAASVVNFMDAKGISTATLVGNSVGAVFAALVAAAHPGRVNKLVLVGCPCHETPQERQEAMATAKASYNSQGIPLPRDREMLKMSYANVTPELEARVNQDRAKAGVWAWKCHNALNSFDTIPSLKKVETKTLIIYGEKDMLRSKEAALKGYIKNSELIIIPNAGHLPQVDNPEGFLAVVRPFLA